MYDPLAILTIPMSILISQTLTDQPQMLKSQIAKAHCSIGELYLTDLCYDDDAEAKCEDAINKAIAADHNSLDGQQGNDRELQHTSLLNICQVVAFFLKHKFIAHNPSPLEHTSNYNSLVHNDTSSALASLRISQCRTAEAAAIIEGVFHRVKAIRDKISSRTVIEEMSGVEEPDECKGLF